MASTISQQLYSRTSWIADGADTLWNFAFTGGYILPAHIGAMAQNLVTGEVEAVPIDIATMLTGPFQLTVSPPIPAGRKFTIFRNTPKDVPLVDFTDGSRVTELNLDTNAKQSVFIAAESLDAVLAELLKAQVDNDFGYKSMKQEMYTGASQVNILDNGRSHYKTDGTAVTISNALKITFLSTVINDSDLEMNLTFTSGSAIMQGSSDLTPWSAWKLGARNLLNIVKVADGRWYISGKVDRV